MAETFYYPPAVAAPRQRVAGAPGPLQLAVAAPAAQRRATVAFRLILAIPHLLVLYGLSIAAEVVLVIGWCCALVTGRLPDFAETYLAGYLSWYSRVGGYLLLLTDQYPPFTLYEAAYPVRLATGSGRLNRLTVLFRLILAIPALIVVNLLSYGLGTLVIFVAWLITLITGRLPASLHQAFAAVLRYYIRGTGYLFLVTGTYPGQLFGDQPGRASQPGEAAPVAYDPGYQPGYPGQAGPYPNYGPRAYGLADHGPQAYGSPGYGAAGYPPRGYQPTGYPAAGQQPPGFGAPWPSAPASPASTGQDAGWQLVLSTGAKRLVGLVLVLGLLTAGGEGALVGTSIVRAHHRTAQISQLTADVTRFSAMVGRHNTAAARTRAAALQVGKASDALASAHAALMATLTSSSTDSSSCTTVYCFNQATAPGADALTAFGRALQATSMPAGSAAAVKQLSADTAASERDWRAESEDTTFDGLIADSDASEKDGEQFDRDYETLWSSVSEQGLALDSTVSQLNAEARALNGAGAALRHRAAALSVTVRLPNAQLAV